MKMQMRLQQWPIERPLRKLVFVERLIKAHIKSREQAHLLRLARELYQ